MLLPILHRVLVSPDPVETTSKGGIIISVDPKKERLAVETGTVVSVGDTAYDEFKAKIRPMIGDKVYYAKYAGKIIKDVDETEYVVLNDEDIVAIIK
jgi:co-chaperonin GroES (HSP10)